MAGAGGGAPGIIQRRPRGSLLAATWIRHPSLSVSICIDAAVTRSAAFPVSTRRNRIKSRESAAGAALRSAPPGGEPDAIRGRKRPLVNGVAPDRVAGWWRGTKHEAQAHDRSRLRIVARLRARDSDPPADGLGPFHPAVVEMRRSSAGPLFLDAVRQARLRILAVALTVVPGGPDRPSSDENTARARSLHRAHLGARGV